MSVFIFLRKLIMVDCLVLINDILRDEKYNAVLSVLKGFRNGVVYGTKVRFPHALVTTLLFRTGSLKDHLTYILKATYTHSRNLSFFVVIYKSLVMLLQKHNLIKWNRYNFEYFIAAFVGGFLIFGRDNKINEQINLYLLARVVYGLMKLFAEKDITPNLNSKIRFPLFGALVWGVAVWLFEGHQSTLQPSLQASMTYLYKDSNHWRKINDFVLSNTAGRL